MESNKNIANKIVDSLVKYTQMCKQHLTEDEADPILEKVTGYVTQLCEIDIKHKSFDKVLKKTSDYIQNSEDPDIKVEELFEKYLKQEKVTVTNNAIAKCSYMIKYNQDTEIEEFHKDKDDTDDILSENFTPPMDPITKTAIRDPVRNKQCGHIYDNESIRELIATKNTRCPYIGCPALQYIVKENLVVDNALKQKIDSYYLNN